MKRVVITGIGIISPLGNQIDTVVKGLEEKRSAVQYMPGWDAYHGLRSLVGAPAILENEKKIPRKSRRSMGRLSLFAAQAADQVLLDANINPEICTSGRMGCIIGSTMGSAHSLNETFELMIPSKDLSLLSSMKFFQCVSHTAAMNVAQYLGINGIVKATSAACASSLQAIGCAYDLIRLGRQDLVLCGGAEEVHPTVTGSFDILYATSTGFNDVPKETPRPFDAKRDGLVCGEGAGLLLIEDYAHAKARNAKIYAEIIGYHTCGSGTHVSQSNKRPIVQCLKGAMEDADVKASDIDYISAHATATHQGDQEEAGAIAEIFKDHVPVSSMKGNLGHTLGASGAIELIITLMMMQMHKIFPTHNLENVSEECRGIFHVTIPIEKKIQIAIKNCFAFGGINASLVIKNEN